MRYPCNRFLIWLLHHRHTTLAKNMRIRCHFLIITIGRKESLKRYILGSKITEASAGKWETMAQALEDSSLSVEISSVDYDEEAEDYDSLTADDAKAVVEYFFSGDQND